jgi:hypothetical protein
MSRAGSLLRHWWKAKPQTRQTSGDSVWATQRTSSAESNVPEQSPPVSSSQKSQTALSSCVPISKIFVADDSNYLVDFVLLFCIVRAIKICILIANITMISEGM